MLSHFVRHPLSLLVPLVCALSAQFLLPDAAQAEQLNIAPSDTLQDSPIAAVSFSGEVVGLDVGRLQEIINLPVGSYYSPQAVRAAVASLYQTGKFETIHLRVSRTPAAELQLDFHVRRARFVTDWTFHTAQALRPEALERLLDLRWGQRFNPEQVPTWQSLLKERYARLGYPSAALELHVEPQGTDRVHLHFTVTEGASIPVRQIRVEGVESEQAANLRRLVELEPGDAISRDAILAGVTAIEAHLASLGLVGNRVRWQLVLPDGSRENQHTNVITRRPAWADLVLRVNAGRKALVEVEGDILLAEGDLAKAITVYDRQSVSPFELETSAARIQALYAAAGYPSARVTSSLKTQSDGHHVRFKVSAGARTRVKAIEFLGNVSFSNRKLEGLLQTRGASPLQPGSPFDPQAWQEDLLQLQEWYVRSGFLQAKVVEAERAPQPGTSDVRLRVQVNEGPQTVISRIQFPGLNSYQQAGALQSVPINPGDPYNASALPEWVSSVQAYMARLGFPLARVEAELEGIHTLDGLLRFKVTPGPRKTVGRILVRGNLKTRDEVIKRQITVQTGDFYDAEELFRTQQQIYQLGFFNRVSVEPARPLTPDPDDPIDLVVVLHERETGWIGLGGGYGSLQGAQLSAEFLQNNVAGTGRPLRVEGLFSIPRASLLASLRDPALWGTANIGELGFSFLSERRREGEPLYQTYGPTIGISRPFAETWLASLRYGWGRTSYPGLTADRAAAAAQLPERINSIFTAGVTQDSRSDVLNPRWGNKLDANVDYSSSFLGGNLVYLRPRVAGSTFVPFPRRVVLALGIEAGYVLPLTGNQALPTDLLFVTGGANSLRGYFNNVFPTGQPEGGRLMLVSHAEVRVPVWQDFGAVFFVDGGNVWSSPLNVLREGARLTGGAGLRYHTPVGPLRVDYGVRLWPVLEWPSWEGLYVGLGHAF